MPALVVPAGASVQVTAVARPDWSLHRWEIAVRPAAGGVARLTFGSEIGGRDVHQRIDIPAQDVECRLEIESRHETAQGWKSDRAASQEDTPDQLSIGFCDASRSGARPDDVLLSFAFGSRDRRRQKEDGDGQGSEEIQPRSPQAQAAEGQAASAGPLVA